MGDDPGLSLQLLILMQLTTTSLLANTIRVSVGLVWNLAAWFLPHCSSSVRGKQELGKNQAARRPV